MIRILLIAALAILAPYVAHADETPPPRVLIVGDSITQGKSIADSGGYSWRYFLWGRVSGPVDFVGNKVAPVMSMADQDPSLYADPNFDYDHAGVAGATLCAPTALEGQVRIDDLVETYAADVVVAAWGINDLRRGASAEDLLDCYDTWLAQARSANPNISVVIARLAWDWAHTQVPIFNSRLTSWAGARTTGASPIVLAQMAEPYDAADTYDGLHPNRQGEIKIAGMMASALLKLGLPVVAEALLPGNAPSPVPPAETSVAAIVRQGPELVVRWAPRARVHHYVLRCGGIDRTYNDPTYVARFVESRAVTCRVRAVNYSGSTYWSDGYYFAGRRTR